MGLHLTPRLVFITVYTMSSLSTPIDTLTPSPDATVSQLEFAGTRQGSSVSSSTRRWLEAVKVPQRQLRHTVSWLLYRLFTTQTDRRPVMRSSRGCRLAVRQLQVRVFL
ncbi:hypothetical protein K466DRAFT_349324 [Polyporus arcularius HHB13444]|uniref:Secreted protein n=1 Tax=Polyporus arcularius HHB13444 TaxID=1314778 RepID=A0A5C3NVT2_9APHY|nr:hypothetical protein K466DRAFT_349324 [Polyporus arcularius HHB13444]